VITPISTAGEFRMLRSDGRRITSGPIATRYAPDPSLGHAAVAFAIRREVGSAVRRNRLRRRLREIFAGFDRESVLPPGRYLVMARPEAAELPFEALRGHIGRITESVAG
jgi:ribonuclease P protein component